MPTELGNLSRLQSMLLGELVRMSIALISFDFTSGYTVALQTSLVNDGIAERNKLNGSIPTEYANVRLFSTLDLGK